MVQDANKFVCIADHVFLIILLGQFSYSYSGLSK